MAIGTLIPSIPPITGTITQGAGIFNAFQSKTKPGPTAAVPYWYDLFNFNYAGEAKFEGSTDITDHVMEDGRTAHDHIAIKPIRITLSGFAGLLAVTRSQIQGGIFGAAQNLVGSIPAYAGKYTPGATEAMASAISQAQAISGQLNSVLAQGKALSDWANPDSLNQMQKAFNTLETYRRGGTPFEVRLPFSKQKFSDMMIDTLIAIEPEDSKMVMDFRVTLKQIQIVSKLTAVIEPEGEPSTSAQRFAKKYLGFASGLPENVSAITSKFGVG